MISRDVRDPDGTSAPTARRILEWVWAPQSILDDSGKVVAYQRAHGGRSVNLLGWSTLRAAWRSFRDASAGIQRSDAARGLRRAIAGSIARTFLLGMAIFGTWFFFGGVASRFGFLGWMLPVGIVVVAVPVRLSLGTVFRLLPGSRRKARSAYRAAAVSRLRVGLCGACAYPLRAIAPSADGLSACPECSARWLMGEWFLDVARRPLPAHALRHAERGGALRTRDARGREWTLLAGHPHDVVRRATRTASGTRFFRPWLWDVGALSIVLASAVVIYLPVALSAGITNPSTLIMLLPSGLCALAVVVMRVGEFRKRRAREVVERTVSAGLCAHCERPLRTAPARSDGSLICECCGAAWASPSAQR